MADLDKTKPVSLENLMVSTLAMADSVTKLLIEELDHSGGVHREAAGGAGGVSAHSEYHAAITGDAPFSVSAKLT